MEKNKPHKKPDQRRLDGIKKEMALPRVVKSVRGRLALRTK